MLCSSLSAQIPREQIASDFPTISDEYTELIINSRVLLAGERLLYKVFSFSVGGESKPLSKMSYAELRDGKGNSIFRHKLKLIDGEANGVFFCPSNIETGIYRLMAYTQHSLNNTQSAVAERSIIVVNPFREHARSTDPSVEQKRITLSLADAPRKPMDQSQVDMGRMISDKSAYGRRESIALQFERFSEDIASSTFVLSVRKAEPLQVEGWAERSQEVSVATGDQFHIPEFRGELVTGIVKNSDGNSVVADAPIGLSVPHKNYLFKLARTNKQGRFFISIDEPYYGDELVVQVLGEGREDFQIEVDEAILSLTDEGVASQLVLKPDIADWVKERSVQLQIENVYFEEYQDLQAQEVAADPFYADIGTRYVLDEYTRFPTIRETFIEVIKTARVRGKDGERVFEIFDPLNPYNVGVFSELDPLVLMDGLPIISAEEILSISAFDIESVYVLTQPYRYGPLIFRGIIDFRSKQGNYRPSISGPFIQTLPWGFPHSGIESSAMINSDSDDPRVPDQRIQLLWDPNLKIPIDGTTVSFPASDVPGVYIADLRGFNADGELLHWSCSFEVQ